MLSAITYLHVRGTLSENMVYTPKLGHESTRPDRRSEAIGDFKLLLLDKDDCVLVSVSPEVSEIGCGSIYDSLRFRVRGSLPMHPTGVTYELRHGDICLYRCAVPAKPPKVDSLKCKKTPNGFSLRWRGSSGKNITYTVVAMMSSGRRITLVRGLKEPKFEVDLTQIPAEGTGKLVIVANDGVRSSALQSEAFELEPRPPTVHILSPQNYIRVPFGQPVSVAGVCFHVGGYLCPQENVSWLIDGKPLITGCLVAVVERPEPGEHRLTMVSCMDNKQVETSVMFMVEEPDESYHQWLATMGGSDLEVSQG